MRKGTKIHHNFYGDGEVVHVVPISHLAIFSGENDVEMKAYAKRRYGVAFDKFFDTELNCVPLGSILYFFESKITKKIKVKN